ncbi:AMP-binding protein [Wenjunlia tyrosinilytica]|uniref:AMP-dependent synthetase/ligase domain-containing protein n=1 Tax=Wenjunlia tyrosinilytica TaxID=1544741 RepID=A0A917ZZF5_9ACTN|nr:AMP-binding protein [Wenjunlia tyrosinilytica]GGP00127.1 hypothetical protein GCM10012280_68170 [Wenjunlia tyrosinilytica]
MHPLTVAPPPAPGPGRTLGALLSRRADARPDARPYPDLGITYAELRLRARSVAAYLGSVTPPGSRVLLAYPAGEGFAVALFGCVMAGMVAVPVPLTEAVGVAQVERAAVSCAPRVLLTTPGCAYEVGCLGGVRVVVADGAHVDGESMAGLAERWRPVGVMPSSPAYLRHVPEGRGEAEFTHEDILVTLLMLARTARLGLDERHLGWLADVHGLEPGWRVLLPVYRGDGG